MERKEQTGHICRWMAVGTMAAVIIVEMRRDDELERMRR